MRMHDPKSRFLGLALFAVSGLYVGWQLGPAKAAGTASGPCATCNGGQSISDANLKYEIGYFTDADELQPPSEGLYGMVPGRVQQKLPAHKKSFCKRTEFDIARMSGENDHTLAFDNPAGWFKSGECWWHTRFTRSALYLTNYRPDLPKPTRGEAERIIRSIISMKGVVEIPGYRNINEFSRDYKNEITDDLSRWHLGNELTVAPAIDAIIGKREEPAMKLQSRLEQMHDRMLQKKAVLWAKIPLKMKGLVAAHAILITDIQPIRAKDPANPFRTTGYELTVIDPNSPHTPFPVQYHFGDTKLKTPPQYTTLADMGEGFIPYVGYDNELAEFEDAIRDYCR